MTSTTLYWLRRDFRLSDHPGLSAAASAGAVLPVVICDAEVESLGAAPKWRWAQAVAAFRATCPVPVVLRRGDPLTILRALAVETDAASVHWTRRYDPAGMDRDRAVKAGLKETGLAAVSHPGHLLFEPWTIETGQGSYYKVYTPFWKAVRGLDVPAPLADAKLSAPACVPQSDDIEDWKLDQAMNRGAKVVSPHAAIGAAAAERRLTDFIAQRIDAYGRDRDRLDVAGTSKLAENLSLGEISPRRAYHAGRAAMEQGKAGAETFVKELVWREFAYHLLYHTPHIASRNWRESWDGFPWGEDDAAALRWKQGQTGEPVIDAAMRELYVTGTMHNRARMLVASYLTKHLMIDWRVGMDWFADCLIDWDPAANAMGWQWAAGSGPDAAPFFRIFNPATQAEKFDPLGVYRKRYLDAEDSAEAADFYRAAPRSWALSPGTRPSTAMVDLKAGRQRALDAYSDHRKAEATA